MKYYFDVVVCPADWTVAAYAAAMPLIYSDHNYVVTALLSAVSGRIQLVRGMEKPFREEDL
jgi:hypothetical protein